VKCRSAALSTEPCTFCQLAGTDAEIYARFLERPREEGRSEIAKDRDRIVHSSALRRLQGKSQILTPHVSDFFRTRLTHSLECAQIGRAIATEVSGSATNEWVEEPADLPDLVEAACLAHDLGHPPFGHNGEEALRARVQEYSERLFEGNAQSFRIVTHIEPKVFGKPATGEDRHLGLNLTRATLKALGKYPWQETAEMLFEERPKFGVYRDRLDEEYFRWVWGDVRGDTTLPATIMDVADNIAYAVHDFEDGVWSGMIPLHDLASQHESTIGALSERVLERDRNRQEPIFNDAEVATELAAILRRVQDEYWVKRPFDRSKQSRADLKNFSAHLIGEFIGAVTEENRFIGAEPEVQRRLDVLTGMAWVWMIERSDLATRQFGQRRLIGELFDGYCESPDMLPRRDEWAEVREHHEEAGGKVDEVWPEKVRLICDHIAGMTDAYALRAHEEMYTGRQALEIRLIY
jgi:dGTPase